MAGPKGARHLPGLLGREPPGSLTRKEVRVSINPASLTLKEVKVSINPASPSLKEVRVSINPGSLTRREVLVSINRGNRISRSTDIVRVVMCKSSLYIRLPSVSCRLRENQ